jgi:hypothetical protein
VGDRGETETERHGEKYVSNRKTEGDRIGTEEREVIRVTEGDKKKNVREREGER